MARVIFNGEPSEIWVNDSGKIQYQFFCQWSNTCGLCAQYDHAIGPSWPIPLHYSCRCTQTLVRQGAEAEPFVDYREKIDKLSPAQQAIVVGKANLQLIEAGTVQWEDVVTRSRVRLLREVVSLKKLSVAKMRDAGVTEYVAKAAHASVTTPAHQLADQQRRELVARLAAKGQTDEQIKRAFGEKLAQRVSIGEGPSGKQVLKVPPKPKPTQKLLPLSQPEPQRKAATAETPKSPSPYPEWTEAKTIDEAKAWAAQYNIRSAVSWEQAGISLEQFNEVNKEFAKIPIKVLETVKQAGLTADLILGEGITDHPLKAHLKGVTPRGWPSERTWDDIPGVGGPKTVLVVNKLGQGHGSWNLVLHEHAHTYQQASKNLGSGDPAQSTEWLSIHRSVFWPTAYQRDYPEEGFAESFAKYFNSEQTRATLPEEVKKYWEAQLSQWSKPK